MPAAYRGKRKSPVLRRQNLRRRKVQPMKKTRHCKEAPFQSTRKQARQKSVTKYGNSSHRKPNSPPLDDSKTLRLLRQDKMYMTTKAKEIMISFVKKLYKWVSVEAERLRRERKRTSIGFTEMWTALKSVMPVKCNKCMENSSKSGGFRNNKAF